METPKQLVPLSTEQGGGNISPLFTLEAVHKARNETPIVRLATPQDIIVALMRVSTIIGCPPPSPTEFSILCEELKATLETSVINTGEIILAYRLAVSSRLDTRQDDIITYGRPLTVFNIVKVVQAYRRWKLTQQTLAGEEQPRQPSREERIKIMIDGCCRAWDNYRATGQIIDYGGTIHTFLLKNDFIERDAEDIANIKQLAFAEFQANLAANVYKTTDDIRKVNRRINQIAAGVLDNDTKAQLLSLRRKISLKMYFQELEFAEEDLTVILKQKPLQTFKLNDDENTEQHHLQD